MPDQVNWPTPAEEKALDRVQAQVKPPSSAELAETSRRCEEAARYRAELEAQRKGQ
jgi:hypothetical protein